MPDAVDGKQISRGADRAETWGVWAFYGRADPVPNCSTVTIYPGGSRFRLVFLRGRISRERDAWRWPFWLSCRSGAFYGHAKAADINLPCNHCPGTQPLPIGIKYQGAARVAAGARPGPLIRQNRQCRHIRRVRTPPPGGTRVSVQIYHPFLRFF